MEVYYARLAESAPARSRGDQLAAERKALLGPLERATHATDRRIAGLSHQLELGLSERDVLRRAGEYVAEGKWRPNGELEIGIPSPPLDR